jgi:hypothetical protein
MKKSLKISVFFAAVSILLLSCEAVSESDKVIQEFYENIKLQQYDKIPELLDSEALAANPANEWIDMITQIISKTGKLKTYSRTSFNTSINNGISKTVEDYTVEYENKTLYDRIVVVQKEGKYKILHWQFNEDKSKLEEVK